MARGKGSLELDPVLRSQLDEASRLLAGDFSVPVPAGARAYGQDHPHYTAGPDGTIKAEFGVRGTVAALRALYSGWARSEGWRLEATAPRDFAFDGDMVAGGASGWHAVKDARRFEIVLGNGSTAKSSWVSSFPPRCTPSISPARGTCPRRFPP